MSDNRNYRLSIMSGSVRRTLVIKNDDDVLVFHSIALSKPESTTMINEQASSVKDGNSVFNAF